MTQTVVRRSRLLTGALAVVAGLLLLTMCSASVGVIREEWILDQGDACLAEFVDGASEAMPGDTVHMPMIVDERWRSPSHATFEVTAIVQVGDAPRAGGETLWLECHAHREEVEDQDVTVIDSVELHR